MPLIGVSSSSFYASLRSAIVPGLQCSIGGGQAPIPADDPRYLSSRDITVTGSLSGGTVWGSNPYTEDSDMNKAAVHAGLVNVGQTKIIEQYAPADYSTTAGGTGYISSTQNGITTTDYAPNWCGLLLRNKTLPPPTEQFNNGDFENGLTNFTVYDQQVSPGGVLTDPSILTTILGCPIPADPTPYPTNSSSQTSPGQGIVDPSGKQFFTVLETVGGIYYPGPTGNFVRLVSSGTVPLGGQTTYGPALVSNSPVIAAVGDRIEFNWSAQGGGDAYNVLAYIIDPSQACRSFIMLDETGNSGTATTPWAPAYKVIGPGEAGNYFFVFLCGSFDYSFGQYLGAQLFVDEIKIKKAGSWP
jgi:hypothetical protein